MRRAAVALFAIALGGLALSGCIGPREMARRHQITCEGYGFTPGTEAYANCLLQLDIGDHGYSHHGRRSAGVHVGTANSPPSAPGPY